MVIENRCVEGGGECCGECCGVWRRVLRWSVVEYELRRLGSYVVEASKRKKKERGPSEAERNDYAKKEKLLSLTTKMSKSE